jgi:hypothetical protein
MYSVTATVWPQGTWSLGRPHGPLTLHCWCDGTRTELVYRHGRRDGPYRLLRRDGRLLGWGRYKGGRKAGRQLIVGSGLNSYFIGENR